MRYVITQGRNPPVTRGCAVVKRVVFGVMPVGKIELKMTKELLN